MAAELPAINRDRPTIVLLQKALAGGVGQQLSALGKAIAAQVVTALGLEKARRKAGGDPEALAEAAVRARKALASLDIEEELLALISVAEKPLEAAAFDGALAGLKQLDLSTREIVTVLGDKAAAWGRDRAAEMVGMKRNAAGDLVPNPNAQWRIDDSTREMIRSTVEKALVEGWSADETSKAIQDSSAFSARRADTIARTEIAKADMAGTMLSYRESGLVIGKRWSTAADDLVSEECVACEEAGGIELDAAFPSGVDAPPNHPNCRCTVLPVLDGEKLGKAQALALIGAIHKRAPGSLARRD